MFRKTRNQKPLLIFINEVKDRANLIEIKTKAIPKTQSKF